MARKEKRFMVHSQQNNLLGTSTSIIVDTETGVQYLFASQGYSGGLTPLLGPDGKPMIDSSYKGLNR